MVEMTLEQATQAKAVAEAELATMRARAETALIRKVATPLLEGYDAPPRRDDFAFSDPVTNGVSRLALPSRTLRRDRDDGRCVPFYENEAQLAFQRMDARILSAFDTVAVGAVEALTNYTIGTGIVVDVAARDGATLAEATLAEVRAFVDEFLETNRIVGDFDRELHRESRIDGERFVEIYSECGDVLVDCREPDEVTQPARKRELEDWLVDCGALPPTVVPSWSFGVLTDRKRTAYPFGYHVVSDSHGNDWDYIPAARMVHVKRTVPRRAKRGVSDFFTPGPDIESHAKLKRNVSEGAAVQAAIAFIRQHAPGVGKTDIQTFVEANATAEYDRTAVNGPRTTSVEQLRPGTIKDIPQGMSYQAGPLGTLNSPVYIAVAQYILRVSGVRWCMPEYIISGDASNANFASTLVAESPFVKAREADQGFYISIFRELIVKAIRQAATIGRLGKAVGDEILRAIDVRVTLPQVASRDAVAQAQTNKILSDAGILSLTTWAARSDLDLGEEISLGATGKPAPTAAPAGPMTGPAVEALDRIGRLWRGYP